MTDKDDKNNNRPENPTSPSDPPFRDLVNTDDIDSLPMAEKQIHQSSLKQLEVLENVYKELKSQAEKVVSNAKESTELHSVKIYARKQFGKKYFLYSSENKPDVEKWFSILPPEEYKSIDQSAKYLGCYLLDYDNMWKKVQE